MKYLVLLCFLVGCICSEVPKQEHYSERIKREAKQFCSCHEGIRVLSFNDYILELICNDGSVVRAKGDMTTFYLQGCEK